MLEDFGQGEVNWIAVAQQVGLIQSLYSGSEPFARSFLLSQETLVSWVANRNTWPPSWLHVQRGNDHFVCLEGSTNSWQIAGHVPGVWIRTGFLGNSSVNGSWWDASRLIKAELGDMSQGRWHFSGHSYGGAVAAILAMELAHERGSAAVELLTFGTPKYQTNGYQGQIPVPYWRMEATTDAVPALPPVGVELVGSALRIPTNWLRSDWLFWDYGLVQTLDSKGGVNETFYDPVANGDLNVIGFPLSHSLSNYWGRLNQRMLKAGGGQPALQLVMAQTRKGFELDAATKNPVGYPSTVVGPGGVLIPIPIIPILVSGGVDMPVYQVNLVFKGKNQKTWRESHAVVATTAETAALKFISNSVQGARTAFLSKLYMLDLVEAVNLENPRDGTVKTAGQEGQNGSVKGETAGVAVSLGYYATARASQRWAPIRGFPDGAVKFVQATGATDLDATVKKEIEAWVLMLQTEGAGYYRRVPENPADATLAKNFVASLDGTTSPGVTIIQTLVPFNPGTAKGITVHIRGSETRRALPGLSGNYYPIISYAGSTVTIPYTIPRGGSIAPGAGTYLRPARFQFAAYNGEVEFGYIYARRTRRMK